MLVWILLEVALGLFMWSSDEPRNERLDQAPLVGAEVAIDAEPPRA